MIYRARGCLRGENDSSNMLEVVLCYKLGRWRCWLRRRQGPVDARGDDVQQRVLSGADGEHLDPQEMGRPRAGEFEPPAFVAEVAMGSAARSLVQLAKQHGPQRTSGFGRSLMHQDSNCGRLHRLLYLLIAARCAWGRCAKPEDREEPLEGARAPPGASDPFVHAPLSKSGSTEFPATRLHSAFRSLRDELRSARSSHQPYVTSARSSHQPRSPVGLSRGCQSMK